MSVASGLIYGLLLFLGVLLGMQILARRSARRSAARYAVEDSRARFAKDLLTPAAQAELLQKNNLLEESSIALGNIEELRELCNANTISEAEFLKRKQEITSKMLY